MTVVAFFLDKDVDDIKRSKCKSKHVFYTTYYDVQNHIFRHANFMRAAASAVSMDAAELQSHETFKTDWCQHAARRWSKWVALCIFFVKYNVPEPNYRINSPINIPLNGPVNPARYEALLTKARLYLGLTEADTDKKINRILKMVERHLSSGTHDFVFKGKWYATLLELDLRDAFAGRPFQFEGAAKRVPAAMAATLDFSQPWANEFALPLKTLLDQTFSSSVDCG